MYYFLAVPRWLFLAILVYAPWAYGSTRPWTITLLNALLALVVILWGATCAVERRRPLIPLPCTLACGGLLALGWFMAWNAHQIYDTELYQFVPISSTFPLAPGAIDGPAAREMMLRISALIGAFLFAVDFLQEKRWRRRFAWTILAAGSSLVAFGLVERILSAPMIFWETGRETQHFFATYFYHGNAGSFINLVLPLAALWTLRVFRERGRHLARALCLPAFLLVTAGAFVNVSKAAMAITVGLLLVLGLLQLPELWHGTAERKWSRAILGGLLMVAALFALVAAGGWETAFQRWMRLPAILRDNPREIVVGIGWKMAADSGWFGFGPGTFPVAFPHYTGEFGKRIGGIWHFLHQDYLQTLIEWGRAGSALWAVLIFGGAGLAAWHGLKKSPRLSEARPLYLAAALGIGATAVHATVDFPFQIASLQLYVITFSALGWSSWFRR